MKEDNDPFAKDEVTWLVDTATEFDSTFTQECIHISGLDPTVTKGNGGPTWFGVVLLIFFFFVFTLDYTVVLIDKTFTMPNSRSVSSSAPFFKLKLDCFEKVKKKRR